MNATSTQPASMSPARRVLDRIVEERFTGLLRVSSHEARGEFWFLAGILEDAVFGVSRGDEALERLLLAKQVVFQAELRLPYLNGGFKKPMPVSGTFAEFRPVVLMRYCESYALTCSLELRGKDRTVRVTYRTGELLSADAAEAGNEALPALLESEEGSYEFSLPSFELPEGVNAAGAASANRLSLAERIDRSLSEESTAAEAKRPSEEAAAAEAKRRAQEFAAAEVKRKAEEAAAAEAKRQAAEAAAAEAKRQAAEAAAAEAKRRAEEVAAAEAKRRAAEAAAAEAKRRAEEVAAAEAKRRAEEVAAAEAKRRAEEAAAAEAKRRAEEAAAAEAKRRAEEAAAAEAKRKAEESAAAEAKRKAEEFAAAEAKRKAKALETPAAKGKRKAKPTKARPKNKVVRSKPELKKKAVQLAAEPSPAESDRQGAEPADVVMQKRGVPWFWLFLVLLLGSLAYFMIERLGAR